MENWKQIRSSRYSVSDAGNVKNNETGKIIRPHKTNKGYLRIGLRLEELKQKKYRVNRLVAEAFLDDYTEDLEVHHKNNIRDDNKVENLKCISGEENKALRVFKNKTLTHLWVVKQTILINNEYPDMDANEILKKIKDSLVLNK